MDSKDEKERQPAVSTGMQSIMFGFDQKPLCKRGLQQRFTAGQGQAATILVVMAVLQND